MRFKEESWLPIIKDKFILAVIDEKAFALDRSDAKKFDKSLADNGLHIQGEVRQSLLTGSSTFYTEGVQSSSKHIIEQYRKAKKQTCRWRSS
jgi:hypothetical protein